MTAPLICADQRFTDTMRAFDSVACDYDGPLGNNALVQHMRESLWRAVRRHTAPGAHLLDIGCGTGLDAVHFAQNGYRVTAIDCSAGMVTQTADRAQRSNVNDRVTVLQLGMQEMDILADGSFDAIYSDLGALNCLPSLTGLASDCAHLLKASGKLICSVIGRYCPWEVGYYLLRGNLRRLRARFAGAPVPVSLNGNTVWTRYYSPAEFYAPFAARFRRVATSAIHLFLPPPYLIGVYQRHRTFSRALDWLDQRAARLPVLNQMGDHFLIVMERRG